jgi:hypothetical protein
MASGVTLLQVAQFSFKGEDLITPQSQQKLHPRHSSKFCRSSGGQAAKLIQLDRCQDPQLAGEGAFICLFCKQDLFWHIDHNLSSCHLSPLPFLHAPQYLPHSTPFWKIGILRQNRREPPVDRQAGALENARPNARLHPRRDCGQATLQHKTNLGARFTTAAQPRKRRRVEALVGRLSQQTLAATRPSSEQ